MNIKILPQPVENGNKKPFKELIFDPKQSKIQQGNQTSQSRNSLEIKSHQPQNQTQARTTKPTTTHSPRQDPNRPQHSKPALNSVQAESANNTGSFFVRFLF